MGKWAGLFMGIAASLTLQGCESTSLFGGDPPPWPGADRAAFDAMQSTTSCRTTLAAPDCRVVQLQPVAGPQSLGPALR